MERDQAAAGGWDRAGGKDPEVAIHRGRGDSVYARAVVKRKPTGRGFPVMGRNAPNAVQP